MVALKKYARIEASALWRASPDAQRREVIVVLGDATLTILAPNEIPLAHWSLAAIERTNPGGLPARFHPDGDPGEELELAEGETEMLAAVETLRQTVARARPHPGRLRWLGLVASFTGVLAVLILWLPGALRDHTLEIVPEAGRAEIGRALITRIEQATGPLCGTSANTSSLGILGRRLGTPRLAVLRGGPRSALHLPGGQILIARHLLEDHDTPDVAAGYILAERAQAAVRDPLGEVLDYGGIGAAFRLLTRGRFSDETLDGYAATLLTTPDPDPPTDALIAAFTAANVASTPYADARGASGRIVQPLIERDPMRGEDVPPLIRDADWLRLQSICTR